MDLAARRPGPDVTRALAMLGVVVMNYHGYLILRGARPAPGLWTDVFDPWSGPLHTRFAATFVVTAGIGVTLMVNRARSRAERVDIQWRLARRGVLLYSFGLAFDWIWSGSILPYYGMMFVIAAGLVATRTRWVVTAGAAAALAAAAIRWWRYERELDGVDMTWMTSPGTRSPRGLVIDIMLNGTHPVLPWLAFLCAGIVIGRVIAVEWWRPAAAGLGLALYSLSGMLTTLADDERSTLLLSDDSSSRSLVYTASALGTALLAVAAISALADRFAHTAAIDALRRAGQLSLTIYLAHALVFNLLVDWLDLVQPAGLVTALVFAVVVWAASTAGAVAYRQRFGRGPAEWLYRRLTA